MRDDLASLIDVLRQHAGPWEVPAARALAFLEEHGPGPNDWPTWETGAELYDSLTPERVTRERAVRLYFEELSDGVSSKSAALRAVEAVLGIKSSTGQEPSGMTH